MQSGHLTNVYNSLKLAFMRTNDCIQATYSTGTIKVNITALSPKTLRNSVTNIF